MIKGIVFDLDGVFFLNGSKNFIREVSERFDIPEKKVIWAYKKSDEMKKFYKTGKWNGDQYWNWFIKQLKIDSAKGELLDILSKGYVINQEVLNLCKKLRSKGYKILACSNNFPERVNILNNKFGFLRYFDFSVFSFEIGILKPNHEVYRKICERSNLNPGEIFLVDDRKENVQSAKDFGIHAVFYTDFKQFVNELKKMGVDVE